jgi:hypothetical protein
MISGECLDRNGFKLINSMESEYSVYSGEDLYFKSFISATLMCILVNGACAYFVSDLWNEHENRNELNPISATICNDEDFEIALKYFDLGAII